MNKSAEEFLEELKQFIENMCPQCECYPEDRDWILDKIEQFQAKQGGNNENSK